MLKAMKSFYVDSRACVWVEVVSSWSDVDGGGERGECLGEG